MLLERFYRKVQVILRMKMLQATGNRAEKSDSCVVQAACMLVKTPTEEQQQGDGCGED